jgi:glycosyltransferase involved in cell wall biosynthesis
VAIDLLASRSGGAQTWTRNLLPLLRERGAFRYTLVLRRSQAARFSEVIDGFERIFAPEATLSPIPRLAWGLTALPAILARRRVDLFFAPTDHPPLLLPCPLALAVRNPTPYTDHPTVQEPGRRLRERVMRALTRAAARRARRVIFVSRAAADAINGHLRVPEERVRVVHHGLDRVIARGVDGPLPPGLPRDFILAVSSFYRYKNYLRLVHAVVTLREVHGIEAPLVICGREIDRRNARDVRAEVERLRLQVHFLGEVGPEVLSILYRHARVFAFPSYLETFGHPLVEAMASGAPVAAADIPTSRELCEDAARYFDPRRPEDIARALGELWRDDRLRADLAARGRARSRAFSWERAAAETEAVLREALGDPGQSARGASAREGGGGSHPKAGGARGGSGLAG